jgi:hypothetical protein
MQSAGRRTSEACFKLAGYDSAHPRQGAIEVDLFAAFDDESLLFLVEA